jgi:ribosomal protein S19E (S16A)
MKEVMACIAYRRGSWVIDYRDKDGIRRNRTVDGSRELAEQVLERMVAGGRVWKGEKKGRRPRHEHGMTKLRAAVNELAKRGLNPVDTTTELGKALMEWRGSLITDLGG